MKKIFAMKIVIMVVITIGIGEMVYNGNYDDIHGTIVSTLCLSCIKLDPVSRLEFVFETSTGEEHPEFILENLTKGIIFIEYRSDVCKACDDMAPIIKEIFHLSFEKEDTLYKYVNYSGSNVNFYHINLDHATKVQADSFSMYDKDQRMGVPMFVVITVKYDRGIIKPCFTAAYGTLGLDTDEERKEFILDMLNDGLSLYEQNSKGYQYP
jgi:thiol-disulfide isomerase/thioredoxin